MEPEKALKTIQIEQVKAAIELVRQVVKQSIDSNITVNGKIHQLPTTKDYLQKEYAYVLEGIRTLTGREYQIQLKEDYKPVQHPP